ncbi:MAG: DUF3422 domain-containing protein [Burkholderiales bacterium]|nr:DUF3422 domain-containing protein [Burkholderiales bacterium]
MSLPPDHPQRYVLANEVHARPYDVLETPERVSFVAVLLSAARTAEHAHLVRLCERGGVHPPPPAASHFVADFGAYRVKYEQHTEYSGYTFFLRGRSPAHFAETAIAAAPADWVASIPGETMVAAHAELLPRGAALPEAREIARIFGGNYVIGAEIGDGVGAIFTDFRVHADGHNRFLVFDGEMSRRQAGRMVQRLFEIETYRMMALLALPVAQAAAPRLAAMEQSLVEITAAMAESKPGVRRPGDTALLERLIPLAAEVERAVVSAQYRFGAARAYHELVNGRIAELRERRLPGTQTIEEFMARRLAPAMATCESIARRQRELSERVARASRLLSTRVDIVREGQNQDLLSSMNRRARLQLRLQETVEGLSVAAITYYVVGLAGYAAKALKSAGVALDADLVMGISIPVVAVLAALGVRHIRRRVMRAERGDAAATVSRRA